MLTALRIRDLAIVESLEMPLDRGLTVITGETGAGKSILIHALKLVLGARAKPNIVRTGAERAEVEALFSVGDDPKLKARLRALDLPEDDELIIRRTLQEGRSRGTVNGRLTTATQLRALATGLVDISSQHDHQSLVDPATHLDTLDAWTRAPVLVAAVAACFDNAVAAREALQDLTARARERNDREDLLRFQLSELVRLDPKAGEIEQLELEVQRLRHAEALRAATAGAEHALYDRERSLCAELGQLEEALAGAVHHDAQLAPLMAQIAGARTELEDAAQQLGRYARTLEVDPESLVQREDRLHELKRLARRFDGDLAAAVAQRTRIEADLADLEHADDRLQRLAEEADEALQAAGQAAEALSKARRGAADELGEAISRELRDLGMGGARLSVEVEDLPAGSSALTYRGARLTARGTDRVELLISPNPGEAPRPLRQIASGGELSRALLATKRVLAGQGPVGTYVFDEVDTGVGGAVAESIGHKLREVALHHQVLCITHAPQIAALGDAHLRVEKEVRDGRTRSKLVHVVDDSRVEELARMLGGHTVTDAARDAARALMNATST